MFLFSVKQTLKTSSDSFVMDFKQSVYIKSICEL